MSLLTARTPTVQIGALPRVDLLPPSEVQRRDVLARARLWVWVGLAALAVAVVTVGASFALNMAASLRLAAEQARTQQIIVGIGQLHEVSEAMSTRSQLQGMRQEAMAGDLAWAPVVSLVAAHLPAGVTITGYSLDAGPIPTVGGDATKDPGVSGTVTFTSTTPIDFVGATRDLRKADGMLSAEVGELSTAQGVPTYTVHVELDQTVYTNAFTPATGASK
jgi:hypothetical protein